MKYDECTCKTKESIGLNDTVKIKEIKYFFLS